MEQELFTLPEHLSSNPFVTCISGVHVVEVVQLHIFTFQVPCRDVHVRYDFSMLPQVCSGVSVAQSLVFCRLFLSFLDI